MKFSRLAILLLIPLMLGCGKERREVKSYLDQIAEELPVIKSVGKETERAFDDLRFGPKTKDLNVLQQRVASAKQGVAEQVEKLKQSHERILALVPPPAAAKLSLKIAKTYDAWLECGEETQALCTQAEAALTDLKTGPTQGRWKRFGQAAEKFGDRARALGKKARDAADLSQEMAEEVRRLQHKYKVQIKEPT